MIVLVIEFLFFILKSKLFLLWIIMLFIGFILDVKIGVLYVRVFIVIKLKFFLWVGKIKVFILLYLLINWFGFNVL